tara:strand:- start:2343 stop:2663 length:321 start_codon:yes stop_codon:yes gene_type:complete
VQPVLAIGLDQNLKESLTDCFHVTSTLEAEELLLEVEVTIIVLNAIQPVSLQEDVHRLLANTPLTTQLILITTQEMDNYTELGINVLTSPIENHQLTSAITELLPH